MAYKNTFKFALEETINKHRLRKDIALLLLILTVKLLKQRDQREIDIRYSKVTDAKEISTFRY